jgi:hypothetical protein
MKTLKQCLCAAIVALAAMALCAVVVAQNLPAISVTVRVGKVATVGASTNAAPTLVTTNLFAQGLRRAWLSVQNTNTVETVTVYAGTNAVAPQVVLAPGQSWGVSYPTIDDGDYSARSGGSAIGVVVSEAWGR